MSNIDLLHFENRYGKATLRLVGEVMHVSKVDGLEVIDAGHGYEFEVASQLTLITGNERLQPVYNMVRRKFYVMKHHTSSTVQVCHLESISCTDEDPYATIQMLNRGQRVF